MNAIINPYNNVSFNNQIPSISHEHCRDYNAQIEGTGTAAKIFSYLYRNGIRHFAISNYYPSTPAYPLDNPLDSSIILTGNRNFELSEIPADAIGCPNAEHHSMNIPLLHINGLGSTFSSGKPKGDTPAGMAGANWRNCFNSIFKHLLYEDGGGATINHPAWTNYNNPTDVLTLATVTQMLDFDDRVLGIEFFNKSSLESEGNPGWDLELWDNILKTGRRCWGFCVPDHDGENSSINDTGTPPRRILAGRNILLSNENEHECLRAYRNGSFYGKIYNSELAFTSINYNGTNNKLSVGTAEAESIDIVIDGVKTRYNSSSIEVTIPDDSTYVRIEARKQMTAERYAGEDDIIFSNPIIFKRFVKKPRNSILPVILD